MSAGDLNEPSKPSPPVLYTRLTLFHPLASLAIGALETSFQQLWRGESKTACQVAIPVEADFRVVYKVLREVAIQILLVKVCLMEADLEGRSVGR